MKKLLSIILAGLMLIGCFSLTAFADEEQAALSCTAGDCRVTLSWEDAGEESYSVYWKRTSSDSWKLAGTTSKHKVNITGLSNDISYDFKVEIGGEFSETVHAVPFADPMDTILQVISENEFEQPYSAEALVESGEVYVVGTYYSEECIEEDNLIMESESDIEVLLEMYCVLPEITEPTDEKLTGSVTRGFTFYYNATKHYLTVDENNTVTWDGADGNYRFTDESVDYFTALENFTHGYTVDTDEEEAVYALLEYFGDGEYSAYAVSSLTAAKTLKSVSGSDDGVLAGSSYYKITLKDGGKLVEIFVLEDDDSYSAVSEVADSLTAGVTVEMPYTAEDFEYISAEYLEEDYSSWNFVEDYADMNSILAMYYSLEYLTEPTDKELIKGNHAGSIMTLSFEIDGETHWFSVDENNTVTWDTVDGNYRFTDENIGYKSAIHHYVFGVVNSTFYEGMKEID
ncbi:MAG: fibronectin type III domain-containing protein [Oscillospiraceae bacterium]|nr:fibronectin type III domain-containing protein [Oscillospiraceae bacterium]